MPRLLAAALAVVLLASPLPAVDSKKAEYVGGTWGQFEPGLRGKLDLSDSMKAVFVSYSKDTAPAEIQYDKVASLEYGQKVNGNQRKHYLTVGFSDAAGQSQGIVFELGKDITRGVLTTFEFRTGKEMKYESEDARASR